MTETPHDVALGLPTERGSHPLDPPAELFKREPVSRLTFADGTVGWLVTRYATAKFVLSDPRFSSRGELLKYAVGGITAPGPAVPGAFILMDAPEHTRYRRLLAGQFTIRRMNGLIPRIQEISDEYIERMRRKGPPAELVADFAIPMPSQVMCELLGVPYTERDRFEHDSCTLVRLGSTAEDIGAAQESIRELLRELVAVKRSQPDEALLSGLVHNGDLTEEELVNVALILLVAGHEVSANMLALGTFTLLTNPDQLASFRSSQDMASNAVDELLRYLTVPQHGAVRTALEDVELDGHLVKVGEPVSISLAMANRDADRFANPATLDVTGSATGHLAFGHGIHQCLGQQLARIEMRIGYTSLFDRLPAMRLAVPVEKVPMRHDMAIYGVHRLPIAW